MLQTTGYQTSGFISALIALYSVFTIFNENLFGIGLIVLSIAFPYLLMKLKMYINEKTKYNFLITFTMNLVVLILCTTIFLLMMPISESFLGVDNIIAINILQMVKGLGFFVVGFLILKEWRIYNKAMRCGGAIFILLGVIAIIASSFALYPPILLKMTIPFLKMIGIIRAVLQEAMFIIMAIVFWRTYRYWDRLNFVKLNNNWDAESNAPMPKIEIDDESSKIKVTFYLNAFIYRDLEEDDEGILEFEDCYKYRFGGTNDEGFYRGQCRFSKTGVQWGNFYQIEDSKWEESFPDDEVIIDENLKGRTDLNHYLFYFRDNTFECIAKSYSFSIIKHNSGVL